MRRWRNESSKRREKNFQKGPPIVWHCAEREGGRRRFYGRVATAEIPRQNANCALFPIFFWLGVDGSQSPLSFQREGFILGRPNIIYLVAHAATVCGAAQRERERKRRAYIVVQRHQRRRRWGSHPPLFLLHLTNAHITGKVWGRERSCWAFRKRGNAPNTPQSTRLLRNCQAGLDWKYKSPIQVDLDHKKIVFRQN